MNGFGMFDQFALLERILLFLAGLVVLWSFSRYASLVGLDRRIVKGTRRHWQLSLIGILALGFLTVFVVFQVSDRAAAALIAVLPPSIYYFYSEHLNRPGLSIDTSSASWSVAPMHLPQNQLNELDGMSFAVGAEFSGLQEADDDDITDITELEFDSSKSIELDTSGARAARPAVFLSYDVINEGKATADRATVQLRFLGNQNKTEHVGRWTDPANSVEYDLRPGQRESVHVAKTFLTPTFIPTGRIASTDDQITEDDRRQFSVRPQFNFAGNPSGEVDIFGTYDGEEFRPITYVPQEKRPERAERSIAGGWEGSAITPPENESREYSLEARVIADNYRTEWEKITAIDIPNTFVQRALNEDHWQDQWEDRLERIKSQTIDHAESYLERQSSAD